jgi:hypothetical protein
MDIPSNIEAAVNTDVVCSNTEAAMSNKEVEVAVHSKPSDTEAAVGFNSSTKGASSVTTDVHSSMEAMMHSNNGGDGHLGSRGGGGNPANQNF